MPGEDREEHVFLVRVWRERTRLRTSDWRGSAQHIGSGDTWYFSRLADLDTFIAEHLEQQRDAS